MSKGSKPRPVNKSTYDENHDSINWNIKKPEYTIKNEQGDLETQLRAMRDARLRANQ